jgi:hypothetical protein
MVREEPPPGAIPANTVIYVDDGSCPVGQIKEVVGGSNIAMSTGKPLPGVPRQRRCVLR